MSWDPHEHTSGRIASSWSESPRANPHWKQVETPSVEPVPAPLSGWSAAGAGTGTETEHWRRQSKAAMSSEDKALHTC